MTDNDHLRRAAFTAHQDVRDALHDLFNAVAHGHQPSAVSAEKLLRHAADTLAASLASIATQVAS